MIHSMNGLGSVRMVMCIVVICLVSSTRSWAQIRVVTYNTLNGPNSSSDPDFRAIFSAIATQSAQGIAKRIDLISLQEQDSTSSVNVAAMLNSLHSVNTYTNLQLAGGADPVAIVYDRASLTHVGSVLISTAGSRDVQRSTFNLVGYTGSEAQLIVYSAHLTPSDTTTDRATRQAEAQAIRSDADALGPGKNIILTGDLNLYRTSESAWSELLAPGNAQLRDPLGYGVGSITWNQAAYAPLHTQSTRVSQFGGGASGGVDDRFDYQLVSTSLLDGQGLSYIGPTAPGITGAHTYRSFGNSGQVYNGNINDSSNTSLPANVLDALYQSSDHLPVIADYQIPARMSVTASVIPDRVLVNSPVSIDIHVTNSAPVVASAGADELNHTITAAGAWSGSQSRTALAKSPAASTTLNLDTTQPGIATGLITISPTSPGVPEPAVQLQPALQVLAHANASFSTDIDVDSLMLDLGELELNSSSQSIPLTLTNLALQPSFTSILELDHWTVTGDIQQFELLISPSQTLPASLQISPSQTMQFTLNFVPNTTGLFTSTYLFNFSDENIPGETNQSLALFIQAQVVNPNVIPEPNLFTCLLLCLNCLWLRTRYTNIAP